MTDLRTAAQMALEALGKWSTGRDMDAVALNDLIATLDAALAQEEQGPVALDIKPPNPEGATQCIVRWWAETPHGWVGAWDKEALEYLSAPPLRKPLTDEEIDALLLTCSNATMPFYRAISRAIERAHGIGGQDD